MKSFCESVSNLCKERCPELTPNAVFICGTFSKLCLFKALSVITAEHNEVSYNSFCKNIICKKIIGILRVCSRPE